MSRRLGLGNSSDLDEAIDLYSELGNKGSPVRTNASYFIYTIAKSCFPICECVLAPASVWCPSHMCTALHGMTQGAG